MIKLPLSYNQRARLATFYGPDKWRRPPVVFALQWDGTPDVPLLRQSLELVVRRHVALRTYFPEPAGPAYCVPAETAEISFTAADQRGIPAGEWDGEWRSRLLELQMPFDLSAPLLIRCRLFRLTDSTLLAFAVDHAVFDGASASVFLNDFSHVYNTLADGGEPSALDVVVSDFSSFAAAEQEWINSASGMAAWEYWKHPWKVFGPFPELPFARVPGPAATYTWQRTLTVAEGAVFRKRARDLRVSPFMLAVSAMSWTLREDFGRDASAMVVMNSRRQTPASLKGVGNYASKLLLATDLSGRHAFEDCVLAVRARVTEAVRHGMMPYELLAEKMWPGKAGMRPDSPYLAFDMPTGDKNYRLGDHVATVTTPGTDDKYSGMAPALFMSIESKPDGTATLAAGYHHARFEAATIEAFLERTHARLLG